MCGDRKGGLGVRRRQLLERVIGTRLMHRWLGIIAVSQRGRDWREYVAGPRGHTLRGQIIGGWIQNPNPRLLLESVRPTDLGRSFVVDAGRYRAHHHPHIPS
jgi:hypothetical protein